MAKLFRSGHKMCDVATSYLHQPARSYLRLGPCQFHSSLGSARPFAPRRSEGGTARLPRVRVVGGVGAWYRTVEAWWMLTVDSVVRGAWCMVDVACGLVSRVLVRCYSLTIVSIVVYRGSARCTGTGP
jgi:hypothetical protein